MSDDDIQDDDQADDIEADDIEADDIEADDDDRGDEDLDANTVSAGTARSVLEMLVTSLVDDPDAVEIDADDRRGTVKLEVRVGPGDMGRVIGRRGRVANAIRTVVRAAAVKDGVEVDVDFED
jgi:predicted RNA-binding protein YlqC (UPF0109 family)